ncbi:MAG: hypothetical protein FWF57_02295 [Defluviitaleaceae bacterium]|nr:hypothetical protein [Defluviitaleaceae bacterium]
MGRKNIPSEDDVIKNQLLDEVFSLEGNHETEKIAKLKEDFLKHMSKNEANMIDSVLQDGLRLLIIYEKEAKYDNTYENFLRLSRIAKPIFDRIENSSRWSARDLEFLSVCLAYTKRVEQAIFLFECALDELKKYYSNHIKGTNNITAWLYNALSVRFLRMDSSETDDESYIVEEKLEDAIEFCEEHNFQFHMSLILVRKGAFFKDEDTINEGLSKLKELGEDKAYEIMLKVVEDYKKRWEDF